jgi:hypothetical protein
MLVSSVDRLGHRSSAGHRGEASERAGEREEGDDMWDRAVSERERESAGAGGAGWAGPRLGRRVRAR